MKEPIATTQLSLPKGGGAIQGIGETFQASEFTGTASLSIPIPTSACRGVEPKLSIDYSSSNGNSSFGLGFSLSIPNIARKTSKGLPKYDRSDTFLFLNGDDLVPFSEKNREAINSNYTVTSYRPRTEGSFARIEHWVEKKTANSYWRVVSKENVTSIFGKTENARISDPENPTHIFQWLLSETFDVKGNHVIYEYKLENNDNVPNKALHEVNRSQTANKYIERIKYGNVAPFQKGQDTAEQWLFEVVFDYGEYDVSNNLTPYTPENSWTNRQDPFSTCQAGFEIRTHRLCRSILMFHRFEELGREPILVNATRFSYQETPIVSLMTGIESIGYRYENGKYKSKSLPPLEFQYTKFEPTNHAFEPLLSEKGQFLPGIDLPPHYSLIDLYGEGIPGILYSDGETTLYREPEAQKNDGVKGVAAVSYAQPQTPQTFPIERNVQGGTQRLMDLTGNGQVNLVVSNGTTNGYYEANSDRSWQTFQTFPSFPNDFSHPDNQLLDVTGDGLTDIVRLDGDRIWVYPGKGKDGFDSPLSQNQDRDLPLPRKGYEEEIWQFTDLFGSGTQQLVRITNGLVECWPSLGYGKFGRRVLLDNAPRFGQQMDASRLFMADLDGSGTADLIYVHSDCVQIWFNQSGNSFSEPITVDLPSKWDKLNQIRFADIYGNGTTCLVFSDNHIKPRHWCYDFCQRHKPYLLNEINNNLGAKSKITYCSSTKFYLEDKQKGLPWIVNLPFPVQVVEKTESYDLISGTKLVSSYAYHHGYYDGVEREFRGFGLVERKDAETFEDLLKSELMPPILTKTWYHTGAWQRYGSLSRQYEREYFQGYSQAYQFPDSIFDGFDGEADAETSRQAYWTLKGMVLREEVYGLDGSDLADKPYAVTETNYRVKLLQAQGDNKYGVYVVEPRETLTYHYERNPEDPRIAHNFTLEVDDYGNVLQDCLIAYGRRKSEALPEQASLKATFTVNNFVNLDRDQDVWLLGVPIESKNYELKDLSLPQEKAYFDFEAIASILKAENFNETHENLLSWERHLYWDESLEKILPLGQVNTQLLLARSEVAVVSQQQIEETFSEVLNQQELAGYLREQGQYQFDRGYWWNPGLKQSYKAKNSFYLPADTTDPFGYVSKVEYDRYNLLVVKVTDAVGNEMTVEAIDYQILQPQKMRDLNDNISEVRFDPLGMVILSSFYGTENGAEKGFAPIAETPIPEFDMEEAIANPQNYLQGTASYFYYDLFAWKNNQIPVHAVNLVAEDYTQDTRVQTSITHSDGFGRELQTKIAVEAGQGFSVRANGDLEEKTLEHRWLCSGRKLYNNKGNPYQEYEPYYVDTYEYVNNPQLNQFGVSSVLHYDPLDRPIRVDTPKGFFTKVEFDPWEQKHYDENDTVIDSDYYKGNIENSELDPAERKALQQAAKFHDTPEIKILDNLGQTVREIQVLEDQRQLVTQYELDIVGNQIFSSDPRLGAKGIKNFQMDYDLTNTVLKTVSVDGGTQWTLQNVMGNPIFSRDSRQHVVKTKYDLLHRPVEVRVTGGDGEILNNIVKRISYGEEVENATEQNLRGQIYQHYDSAGLVEVTAYSLDGQPQETKRRLREDYKVEANWKEENGGSLLQAQAYTTSAKYDALGRVIEATDADGNISRPVYDLSGSLVQMLVTHGGERAANSYVESISYNPKGQRTEIRYGNGVRTKYEYEKETFFLKRILTKRIKDKKTLQDLNYTYDPVGNITQIEDKVWSTVFNNNQIVEPISQYTYDALYRLVSATGREHEGMSGRQERKGDIPEELQIKFQSVNNGQALSKYTRHYSYDDGGNLYRIKHSGKQEQLRIMTVSEGSNRAVDSKLIDENNQQSTALQEIIDKYFDANGNQIKMKGIPKVQWNYGDNIAKVTLIEREEGKENDGEYYVYDSSGSRIRKVTERYGNEGSILHIDEVIYLGGLEIRRTLRDEIVKSERHSLRVMDDESSVAVRNHWTVGEPPKGVNQTQVRYQLENHLGSAAMEVDSEGQLISYEEYFPYGGTAYVVGKNAAEVKLKHYRYSGKERDASTGLYYYGARYYAPWLGRWMSCDPAGTVDGLNLYGFVGGNPIKEKDLEGKDGIDITKEGALREMSKAAGGVGETKIVIGNKVLGKFQERRHGWYVDESKGNERYYKEIIEDFNKLSDMKREIIGRIITRAVRGLNIFKVRREDMEEGMPVPARKMIRKLEIQEFFSDKKVEDVEAKRTLGELMGVYAVEIARGGISSLEIYAQGKRMKRGEKIDWKQIAFAHQGSERAGCLTHLSLN